MKITIIGTINKDIIIPSDSIPVQSLGGIFYALSALRNFLNDSEQITPVSYFGENIAHLISGLKNEWCHINFDGFVPFNGKNHEVILEYSNKIDRSERALFFFPELKYEHIEPFLDADFILVNMITGKELSVTDFQKIAQVGYEKLYLDVHSLMLDVDEYGNRIFHRPDDIFEWINYARFLQMNEREYELLNQENIEFERFWESILRPSQHVFLTLGDKGVMWVSNESGLKIKKFPSYFIPDVKDTTGCGDVFGASFSYHYCKHRNISTSLEFAVLAASASTMITGTENFYLLKSKMAELNERLLEAALQ